MSGWSCRLKAAGYTDTNPNVSNRDMFDVGTSENLAQNRLVGLRMHP